MQNEPQGDFELCCGLLVPLYAARATEEVFYGKQGVTLGTAQEVSLTALLHCTVNPACIPPASTTVMQHDNTEMQHPQLWLQHVSATRLLHQCLRIF